MSRFRAIIFDLDDTLYPEESYAFSGFEAVADWAVMHLGIPQDRGFATLRNLYKQGVRGVTFNRFLEIHNHSNGEVVERMVRVYREHQPSLTLFPGAKVILAALQEQYNLGLVSDGYLEVQKRKLGALGIADLLDAVVFSDTLGRSAWKPSIRPFERVLEKLGNLSPDRAIYVADNPKKDFLAPRKMGMGTIRVRYPNGVYASLEPTTPDYASDLTIESLDRLIRAIRCLEGKGACQE